MENRFQYTSATVSDRGLSEKRPQNEDSYIELPQHGVYAVADGVGGAQAGDVASQMAVEILGEAFINLSPDADPEDTMKMAIERANSAIFQMSRELPQLASMATTIAALHVSGEIATIAHVGDSRIYRVDSDGHLFRETQDHSVVEEEVRAGRMTAEQAFNHPSRNVISRALGAEDSVEIDVKMLIVHPSTTFLLCSDGITRHIDDSEIAELLASENGPGEICQKMKEICFGRGAEDNLTALIVRSQNGVAAHHTPTIAVADSEPEQVTVAAGRPPFDRTVEREGMVDLTQEDGIRELIDDNDRPLQEQDDGAYLMADVADLGVDEPENDRSAGYYASSKVVVPARDAAAKGEFAVLADKYESVLPDKYTYENAGRGESFSSKVLSALALLLIGGILGVGGYYFLLRPDPPPPQTAPELPVITEMKSNNTALTAFEEGRRQVDSDPARYITVNAASPQEAEDYFLLARAFLLTGKYWDAKRFYNLAKDRLSQVEPSNARTLSAEIAMALAIIESTPATQAFERDLAAGRAVADGNSNVSPDPNQVR